MAILNLLSVEFKQSEWAIAIKNQLSGITGFEVHLKQTELEIKDFFVPEKGQYNASEILRKLEKIHYVPKSLILTSVDLFIPIFTYVFGLAKLDGNSAIVSACRLDNNFYGLPRNDELLITRLQKEVNHETGHMFGLRHCQNYNCVMSSSITIDDLDVKLKTYCDQCLQAFR